jgi:hypothetical protein
VISIKRKKAGRSPITGEWISVPVHVQELQLIQFGASLLEAHFISEQRPVPRCLAGGHRRPLTPNRPARNRDHQGRYHHLVPARPRPTEAKWGNLAPVSRRPAAEALVTIALTGKEPGGLARTVLGTCDLARGIDEPAPAVREIFNLLRNGRPH